MSVKSYANFLYSNNQADAVAPVKEGFWVRAVVIPGKGISRQGHC